MQRAQRVGERHGAEEEIRQQIIDAQLCDLPLDLGAHGRRRTGDHGAVGKTGFVQLGFAHQGIMFLHESSTEWYDRYQHLLESLESVGDIVINDDADEE